MREWLPDLAALALTAIGMRVLLAVVLDAFASWERRLGRAIVRTVHRRARTPGADVVVLRRPVEEVAADVRRLRAAFGRPGVRFAKWEGTRQAYDDVLAEAADTLGIEHHLHDLPPGTRRDFERERVERALVRSGLLPRADAA